MSGYAAGIRIDLGFLITLESSVNTQILSLIANDSKQLWCVTLSTGVYLNQISLAC